MRVYVPLRNMLDEVMCVILLGRLLYWSVCCIWNMSHLCRCVFLRFPRCCAGWKLCVSHTSREQQQGCFLLLYVEMIVVPAGSKDYSLKNKQIFFFPPPAFLSCLPSRRSGGLFLTAPRGRVGNNGGIVSSVKGLGLGHVMTGSHVKRSSVCTFEGKLSFSY